MTRLLLIVALLLPLRGSAQTSTIDSRTDSIARASVRAEFMRQEDMAEQTRRRVADSAYHAQVEFAVQRWAVDWSSMSTLVAALGVLFAAGAIIAGYLFFRQSRDYRERLDETLSKAGIAIGEYRVILEGFLTEKRAEIDRTLAEVREKQAATDDADGEETRRLDEQMRQLERVQATLTATAPAAYTGREGARTSPALISGVARGLKSLFASQPEFAAAGLTVTGVLIDPDRRGLLSLGHAHGAMQFLFGIPDEAFWGMARGDKLLMHEQVVLPAMRTAIAEFQKRHPSG